MRLERKLKALANKRRLAIVKYLEQKQQATVGEIAAYIKLSFKSTSRHLYVLAGADVIDKEQRSREVYYFLQDRRDPLMRLVLSKVN